MLKDSTLAAVVIYYLYTNNRKKPSEPIAPTSGEMPKDYWDGRFDKILEVIEKQGENQTEAVRDLTKTLNELITTLLRQGR